MSNQSIMVWTCDRCGFEQRTEDRDQPVRWYRVTKSAPPLGMPLDVKDSADWQLCPRCSESFHDWFLSTDEDVKAA